MTEPEGRFDWQDWQVGFGDRTDDNEEPEGTSPGDD